MRFRFVAIAVAVTAMCLAAVADAQPGGGRPGGGRRPGGFGSGGFGGFGGGGFGVNQLTLLGIKAVQEELELTDDQIKSISKLIEESRSNRGGFFGGRPGGDRGGARPGGDRGRPGGDRRRPSGDRRPGGNRPQRPKADDAAQFQAGEFFVQAEEDKKEEQPRRRFQDLSEEERQKLIDDFRKQREQRQKKQNDQLNEVLLPHQVKRLTEIMLQVQGVGALNDPEVVKQLKITKKQQDDMRAAREKAGESMGKEIRALFESGNREGIREKMTELRKGMDNSVLAVLSSQQKSQFEKMKGKPFKLPEGALRGGFGFGGQRGTGGRRPGGGGEGGRRPGGEGRPQRPDA